MGNILHQFLRNLLKPKNILHKCHLWPLSKSGIWELCIWDLCIWCFHCILFIQTLVAINIRVLYADLLNNKNSKSAWKSTLPPIVPYIRYAKNFIFLLLCTLSKELIRCVLKRWFHPLASSSAKTDTSSVNLASITQYFIFLRMRKLWLTKTHLTRAALKPCICPKCRLKVIGRATDMEAFLRCTSLWF